MIVRNNFYVCDIKIDISLGAAFLTVYKYIEERRRNFDYEAWLNASERVCLCVNSVLQIGYSKTEFEGEVNIERDQVFNQRCPCKTFRIIYIYVLRLVDLRGVEFLFFFVSFLIRMCFSSSIMWGLFLSLLTHHHVFGINILDDGGYMNKVISFNEYFTLYKLTADSFKYYKHIDVIPNLYACNKHINVLRRMYVW